MNSLYSAIEYPLRATYINIYVTENDNLLKGIKNKFLWLIFSDQNFTLYSIWKCTVHAGQAIR